MVSECFQKHRILFETNLDQLVQNIELFLEHEVDPIEILKGFRALMLPEEIIEARLKVFKENGIKPLPKIMTYNSENFECVIKNLKLQTPDEDFVLKTLSTRLKCSREEIVHQIGKNKFLLKTNPQLVSKASECFEVINICLNLSSFPVNREARLSACGPKNRPYDHQRQPFHPPS